MLYSHEKVVNTQYDANCWFYVDFTLILCMQKCYCSFFSQNEGHGKITQTHNPATFIYSKSTIKALEKGVKNVQI